MGEEEKPSGSFKFNVPVSHLQVQRVGPRFQQYQLRLRLGHDGGLSKSSSADKLSDTDVIIEADIEYLKTLDPKEWKDQDHYAVLGLKHMRFNAAEEDIKRAYRKCVLKHHPDKRKAKGEEVHTDDDYFTCITKAYETLGNPKSRRAYDSVDPEFDDSLPSISEIEKNFYKTFYKFFSLNARWSEKKNVPSVGDENSTRGHVEHFYNFWYDFQSWREYSYLDEEDKDKGQDREERRWIEKQNKAIRIKRKKEEMSRIRSLVDLAYNNDPRILKFKNEEKQKKLAAKRAKMDAVQAQKAEEERALREVQLAKEKADQAEQKRIELIRIEREQQKRALKKERKLLRDTARDNNYYASNDKERLKHMEGVEKICEMLKITELQDFNKELEKGGKNIFDKVLIETEQKLEEERKAMFEKSKAPIAENASLKTVDKNAMWGSENMQLLIKAVNLFPAGTSQRWEVIATFMNQHSTNMGDRKFLARDVLNKAKDLQSSDFSKNALKSQANEAAFNQFEKSKKELKKLDRADISINTEKSTAAGEKTVKPTPKENGITTTEQNGIDAPKPAAKTATAEPAKPWTKDEQALLEQAIKTFPITTADRWERIAECVPNRTKKDCLRRVKELVDRVNAKKEAQQAVTYSLTYEVAVDFTRDYDSIRQALKKIEHGSKASLEDLLQAVSNSLSSNWGTQNYCQVLIYTDCGIGLGKTSIKRLITNISASINEPEFSYMQFLKSTKLSFMSIGNPQDDEFIEGTKLYQQFLDASNQKGQIFVPKIKDVEKNGQPSQPIRNIFSEMTEKMCEVNFKQFEASLKCGGYFKLESPIYVWPAPLPHKSKDTFGNDVMKIISKRFEICGFLSLSDIGSPISVSRHLIIPKVETEKLHKRGERPSKIPKLDLSVTEYERLDSEIKTLYSRGDGTNSDDEGSISTQSESTKESVCVLLHGALKVENMAALVLLSDSWYGFIYSYADSKKKSNLMLNVLPPGNDVIPWLGDFRLLATIGDALPDETFPVKPEKRSYSQNILVWIKQAGLQSDIQKVLRNAKKLPDKTQNFYKELNRIRRAALSLGFIELLEGLANIFDREVNILPANCSQDCTIQLKHAANELRKIANRDLKNVIAPHPTKYNQVRENS